MKVDRKAGRANGPDQNRSERARSPRRARAAARRPHESRTPGQGPQTAPAARPAGRPAPAKNTGQAQARAKARKAKAPKVVRPPLRERLRTVLIAKLDGLDLRPQALLARIPFVVLVIGSLALGLGITLWLSTDAARRSYQLGNARALNDALTQQKEALERDVLQAESAPELAESARELGMIPSRGNAHLVQDPGGQWVVVGEPKPAEGVPPPPLNTKLPEEKPPPPPAPPGPKPGSSPEVLVRVPAGAGFAEQPVRLPPGAQPVLGTVVPPAAVPYGPVQGAPSGAPLGPGSAPAGAQVPGGLPAPSLAPLPAPADLAVPGPAAQPVPAPAPFGVPAPGPAAAVEPVPAPIAVPVAPPAPSLAPVPAPTVDSFPPPVPGPVVSPPPAPAAPPGVPQ